MLINEIHIFFIIITLIGLSFYDLKYSIIFCIILYLLYLYFNKLTFGSNYEEYKYFDDEIKDIIDKISYYRKYDEQNFKLGLKSHYSVLKNIKLLNNSDKKYIFNSILEKINIYIDNTVNKFNSIIFSIDSIEKSEKLTNLINTLKLKYSKLLDNIIKVYNNKNDEYNECDNMFCNDDLRKDLFLDKENIIDNNKIMDKHNMFDRGLYLGIKGNEVYYRNKNIINNSSIINRYISESLITKMINKNNKEDPKFNQTNKDKIIDNVI
jgi:hypothetical protein